MVLSRKVQKEIVAYVQKEPRTIKDIATNIGRSWITADSYVAKIIEETGLLQVKLFRGGTRGALKIAYYNYVESAENEQLQKELFERIRLGQKDEDFDPLDIYQYISTEKKRAFSENYTKVLVSKKQNLAGLFRSAEHEILCFSGNLSWLNVKEGDVAVVDLLEEVANRDIAIRILARVDIGSRKQIQKVLGINKNLGKKTIDVKHRRQPLRGFIIDNKLVRLKEEKEAGEFKEDELDYNTRVFYELYDEEWVAWLKKVFWALYRFSVPAERRMKEIEML